jgi:hypothetical protein
MKLRRLLVAVTFVLSACNSSKPPFTPQGVSAVAGDQIAIVHWSAAAGAAGYVVYYNGDDVPVTLASQQSAPTPGTSLAISGLVNSRKYRFAVQAANGAGASALSAEATAIPTASLALSVAVTPADASTAVSRAAGIQAIFNQPMQPQTLTTAVASSSCAGASFQVSADGFATCVQMKGAPVASNANQTYTLTPAAPLTGATKYQVRITTAAAEPGGGALASPFNSSFTTSAALALVASVPADGATAVSLRPALSLTFNRAPRPASLTAAAAGTACTGSIQLSRRADNFALCVPLVLSGGATSFTLTPAATLAGATAYVLKVTAEAQDSDGVGPASPLLVGFTTDVALAVSLLSPAQGSSGAALDAPVAVRFNRAADPATVSINSAGTGCTGSLQISADSFATCVPMAAPVATDSNQTFTVAPLDTLLPGTTYDVRVTTAVADPSGVPLAAVFTASPGFTTNLALAVLGTSPADSALAVPVNTSVSVTFNRSALPSSITVATSGSACTGSLQLSGDGFQTCVPMSAQPQAQGFSSQVFVITPAALLAPSTAYQVRVTTSAQDSDGVALQAVFTSPNGFVTDGPLAVVATTPAGPSVPLNAADIGVVFSRPVQPASVTANTADSQCTGSVQLSRAADNFSTCVRLATQPAASSGNTKFLLTLAGLLDANTHYLLRVTSAVVDLNGVPLSATFTSQSGFVTDSALAVASVAPADGTTAVPLNASVAVTFNKPAAALTTNVDNQCSGSLQLSADGFTTCVAMRNPAPAVSNGGATFTAQPAAPLPGGALYRLRITTGARDQAGVALAAQFTSGGFVADAALAVISTSPKNGDIAVSRVGAISVTFNKPADLSSVTSAIGASTTCGTFQVSLDPAFGSCLAMQSQPSADAASRTFTATPAATLPGATRVYLRVSTGARDQAGVALAANSAVVSFTTNAPLAVTQVVPAAGDAGIALNTTIAVTFNQPAQLSVNSADDSCAIGSLQLSRDGFAHCVKMAATLTVSPDGKTFTARPAATLAENTTYGVRVTSGAKDLNGIPGAGFSSSFTTDEALAVQSTVPMDSDAGVALIPSITVTFNRPAAAATITTNTAGNACSGSVQLSADGFATCVGMSSQPVPDQTNQVFTVAPLAQLSGLTTYQLRVTTAATDPAGVALAIPWNSSFTTEAALTVVSTSPADGATNVSTGTPIAVTFNKDIDPSTLTFTTNTVCSGSLQISADPNFRTCNPLVGPLNHTGFTWQLSVARSAPLATGTVYFIRVTTALADSGQVPLAAQFTQPNGFTTVPRFAVSSVAPADRTAGVALNAPIVVVFNKMPFGLSVNTSDTVCSTETLQVSDGSGNCVRMTGLSSSADKLTWTATPSALASGTTYKIRVAQGVTDATGTTLAADYLTPNGFTTVPTPLTVTSAPANGAGAVAASSNLVLTFSSAPNLSTVTTGDCAASVTLSSSGSCVALTGPVVSSGGKVFTFTPAAKLAYGQQYVIGVSTAVQDGQGTPLAQAYSASFTVASPPANPSLAAAGVALQSASLSWTSPGGTYDHANVYSRASGAGAYALLASTAAGATSFTATSLLPFRAYDLKVTSVDAAGNESTGSVVTATTAFTGSSADWLPGQASKGIGIVRFRFAWTDTDFVAAVSDVADNKYLNANHPDALWVAFDTDPATDATGDWSTSTVGVNDVIWPFKANYVVELVLNGSSYTVNSKAAGAGFAPLSTDGFNGTIDEVRIPRAAIGNPAGAVRFALIAVNKQSGFTYDLAPVNYSAVDAYGYHSSITSGFAPGAASWTTAATATSVASSPAIPAAALVTLSVSGLGASPPNVTMHGSLAPFNYDISLANYVFHDDGRYGDTTANDGIYTGVFNLGASTQELFFQFDRGGGTAEFSGGRDRVWALSGTTEALPTVVFNTAYSATHPFALTFNVNQTAGVPTRVTGSAAELGTWTPAAGAPLTLVSGSLYSTGPVSFGAQDFTVSSLGFKAYSDSYEGGNDNSMDDDVINRRVLSWSFNSTQGF